MQFRTFGILERPGQGTGSGTQDPEAAERPIVEHLRDGPTRPGGSSLAWAETTAIAEATSCKGCLALAAESPPNLGRLGRRSHGQPKVGAQAGLHPAGVSKGRRPLPER